MNNRSADDENESAVGHFPTDGERLMRSTRGAPSLLIVLAGALLAQAGARRPLRVGDMYRVKS